MNRTIVLFRGRRIVGFCAMLVAIILIFAANPTPVVAAGWQQQAGSEQPEAGAENGASQAVTRVSLGEITGSPGASLMIPLYYTPAPGVSLRSIAVELEYVSNHLKFEKASPGVVTEGADVSATLTDGTPNKDGIVRSQVRVDVSLAGKNPEEGIPEGLLAFLLFRVTPDAKPFAIRLNASVVSAKDLRDPAQEVAQVAASNGLVVVELADVLPEATCFFFTH